MHAWPLREDLITAMDRLPPLPLGPGVERTEHQALLDELSPSDFRGADGGDHDAAKCCLAGVWLRFGFLETSHTISQAVHTAEGSYWHGIMHRHEPDYGNAKYWFRQTGDHPLFGPLGAQAAEVASSFGGEAAEQWRGGDWDPFAFVDFCQQEEHSGSNQQLAVALVELEWNLLFDYCLKRAQPQA